MESLPYKNIVVGISSPTHSLTLFSFLEYLFCQGVELDIVLCEQSKALLNNPFLKKVSSEIHFDMFLPPAKWNMSHLSLSDKADLFFLPFFSPDILAKLSIGIADDLLSSTLAASGQTPVKGCYLKENLWKQHLCHHLNLVKKRGMEFVPIETESLSLMTLREIVCL